jgi:hypothetical protein
MFEKNVLRKIWEEYWEMEMEWKVSLSTLMGDKNLMFEIELVKVLNHMLNRTDRWDVFGYVWNAIMFMTLTYLNGMLNK